MIRPARRTLFSVRGSWTSLVAALTLLSLVPLLAGPGVQQANAQVQVEEDEEGEDGRNEREEDGPGNAEVYESPTFGFSLAYDPAAWEVIAEDADDGSDDVTFTNGPSFVTLSATRLFHGDVDDCLDEWSDHLAAGAGVEEFAVLTDGGGDPIAVEGDGFVRAAFAYRSSDGDEVFDLECRVLVEDEATLTIVMETFAGEYALQSEARDDLIEGLDLPDLPDGGTDGPLLVADDFDDEANGIFTTESADPALVRYAYDGGEFVIETLERDAGTWQVQLNGPYGDVEIAVDVRIVGSTRGRYVKIGCRFSRTRAGFDEYSLVLDPDARRVMLYRSDGEEVTILVDEDDSDLVNPDEESNRLELRCIGQTIEVAINGERIARVEDDAFASGAVYLGAGSYSDAPRAVEARFDNFELRVLDPARQEGDDDLRHDEGDGDETVLFRGRR